MMKSVVKRKWNIIFLLFSTWGGGHLGLCITPPNRLGGGGERREGEKGGGRGWVGEFPEKRKNPPLGAKWGNPESNHFSRITFFLAGFQ